jgi:uncharacterized OB-fold protein
MIRPAPRAGREAAPHWKAAAEGVLRLPFCSLTGKAFWPPSGACEAADGSVEWRACEGGGVVESFSVVRRAVQPEWKDGGPYVVAMIALDAEVRMLSNVVECDPDEVTIGARVAVAFVPTTDPALGLAVFKLVRAVEDTG